MYKDRCFLFNNLGLNWEGASDACRTMGGFLVRYRDKDEKLFVGSPPGYYTYIMLGLHQLYDIDNIGCGKIEHLTMKLPQIGSILEQSHLIK